MRLLFGLALAGALSAAAYAADNPDWAYPPIKVPKPADATVIKTVPASSQKYSLAQIDDPFNPPDWFPNEHPPMPQVVAHGGPIASPEDAANLFRICAVDGFVGASSMERLPIEEPLRANTAAFAKLRVQPAAST